MSESCKVFKSGEWEDVKEAALFTVGKELTTESNLSKKWKKTMLLAEHSPIREMTFKIVWRGIKGWVAQHFSRHHVGVTPSPENFVRTSRTDRTGINRDDLKQAEPVNYMLRANTQALINMSRKRLCIGNASTETREEWEKVVSNIKEIDPIVAEVLVPECIYRGFCPEFNCCGFVNTKDYFYKLENYRRKLYSTN